MSSALATGKLALWQKVRESAPWWQRYANKKWLQYMLHGF